MEHNYTLYGTNNLLDF